MTADKRKKRLLIFAALVLIIGLIYISYLYILPKQVVSQNTNKVGHNLPFLPKIGSQLVINRIEHNGSEYRINYRDSKRNLKWITITKGEPFPYYNSKNELIKVKYSTTIDHSYIIRTVNTIGHIKWLNINKHVLNSYNYIIFIKT